MRDSIEHIEQDIAFVRSLVEEDHRPPMRDSAVMVAVGAVFGLMGVRAWLIGAGLWDPPAAWRPWMLLDAPVLFLVVLALILRRYPAPPAGPLTRAVSAAWSAVGAGVAAMATAFGIASWRAQDIDVMGLFTPMLFILYGMAWWIAYRIRLRTSLRLVALGSFATAAITGSLVGRPELWLAEALGLVLWVLAPGLLGLRAARLRTGA